MTNLKSGCSHGPECRTKMEAFPSDCGRVYSDRYTGEEPRISPIRRLRQNCLDIVEVDFLGSKGAGLGRFAIEAERAATTTGFSVRQLCAEMAGDCCRNTALAKQHVSRLALLPCLGLISP